MAAAFLQVPHHPPARAVRHLGQDPVARLDEVERELGRRQLGVAAQEPGRQGQQLAERLHAREAAADHRDGQELGALGPGRETRGPVDRGQEPVAHRDGLLDVLEPDALGAQAGDGERARHGTGGHDQRVVADRARPPVGGAHRGRAARVVDRRDVPGDDPRAPQVRPERDRDVPGLDRAGRHLWQERLVGHVAARVDDRDLGLPAAEPLLQVPRRVEPGVAAADDEDPSHPNLQGGLTMSTRWRART